MKTKKKILEASLYLYNTQGVREVSTRSIANYMGISAGNLHYHYKHTEDIIHALFADLSQSFDDMLLQIEHMVRFDSDSFSTFVKCSYDLMIKYKFLFLHFVEIGNWIPEIRDSYYTIFQKREKQCMQLFEKWRKQGYFRDDLPSENWKDLVRLTFIVSDFWLSNNELTERLEGEAAFLQYNRHMLALMSPYLKTPIRA